MSTRRLARQRARERLWKSVKYEEVYLHAYDPLLPIVYFDCGIAITPRVLYKMSEDAFLPEHPNNNAIILAFVAHRLPALRISGNPIE
jgi:hypothetical protein